MLQLISASFFAFLLILLARLKGLFLLEEAAARGLICEDDWQEELLGGRWYLRLGLESKASELD